MKVLESVMWCEHLRQRESAPSCVHDALIWIWIWKQKDCQTEINLLQPFLKFLSKARWSPSEHFTQSVSHLVSPGELTKRQTEFSPCKVHAGWILMAPCITVGNWTAIELKSTWRTNSLYIHLLSKRMIHHNMRTNHKDCTSVYMSCCMSLATVQTLYFSFFIIYLHSRTFSSGYSGTRDELYNGRSWEGWGWGRLKRIRRCKGGILFARHLCEVFPLQRSTLCLICSGRAFIAFLVVKSELVLFYFFKNNNFISQACIIHHSL